MFDYDGTLTPLRSNVDRSFFPASSRRLLERLAHRHKVVIVSGRDLDDLRRLAGPLKGIGLVGTHGAETRGIPGFSLSSRSHQKRLSRDRKRLMTALRRDFKGVRGIFLQEKRYALSIHYAVWTGNTGKIREIQSKFKKVVRHNGDMRFWTFQSGRAMLDLRPRGFSKSSAVRQLLKRFPNHVAMFAGDDRSDRGALAALGRKGLKVAVGKHIPNRLCDRRFPSPSAFLRYLQRLT